MYTMRVSAVVILRVIWNKVRTLFHIKTSWAIELVRWAPWVCSFQMNVCWLKTIIAMMHPCMIRQTRCPYPVNFPHRYRLKNLSCLSQSSTSQPRSNWKGRSRLCNKFKGFQIKAAEPTVTALALSTQLKRVKTGSLSWFQKMTTLFCQIRTAIIVVRTSHIWTMCRKNLATIMVKWRAILLIFYMASKCRHISSKISF